MSKDIKEPEKPEFAVSFEGKVLKKDSKRFHVNYEKRIFTAHANSLVIDFSKVGEWIFHIGEYAHLTCDRGSHINGRHCNTVVCGYDCNVILKDDNMVYAGMDCSFTLGDGNVVRSGDNCAFNAGWNCTFITTKDCIFSTDGGCTFTTDGGCKFTTGDNCHFECEYDCEFNVKDFATISARDSCKFDTGKYCTINCNDSCEFKLSESCTVSLLELFGDDDGHHKFKTYSNSIIIDRTSGKRYLMDKQFIKNLKVLHG